MLLMHRMLRICSVTGGAPCPTSRDDFLERPLSASRAGGSAVCCSQNDRPGSLPEETSPLRNDPEYQEHPLHPHSLRQSGPFRIANGLEITRRSPARPVILTLGAHELRSQARARSPFLCRTMRRFASFAILLVAACTSDVTARATAPDPQAGTYTLDAVDGDTLPAQPDYSSGSRWVLSGSLTLEPDGYFVLVERDSVWNGRTFAGEEWTKGGQWTTDGSLLTLNDTSAAPIDTYGGGSTTYLGSIASDAVLLRIGADDGTEAHSYQYER